MTKQICDMRQVTTIIQIGDILFRLDFYTDMLNTTDHITSVLFVHCITCYMINDGTGSDEYMHAIRSVLVHSQKLTLASCFLSTVGWYRCCRECWHIYCSSIMPQYNVVSNGWFAWFTFPTRIFYRGVPGFATDCPCAVWCRGLTSCLLYLFYFLEI